ncbi:hypothetical protein CPJCM30710_01220 [Clostridium polyendosporum]|uniref:V/A-type H+-transporting ATPase subunit C n=1 Tax=Clostridium polyendosporum TaxID=69208 RepID=A0A919RW24_9CLOT|nr:V-type ATPase subunit [Clostridium polyendosporum]GIM27456.1 hypothetical protein CPJCM30710_01220 [Clostridium polyendosporum]
MGDIVKYGAINAKVKALTGRMIKKDQYKKLLNAVNFMECIKILKEETSYVSLLNALDLDNIHRIELEVAINKYYTFIYEKLVHYFNGEYRRFFKEFFRRLEIEDLKIILRGKAINKNSEEIFRMLTSSSKLSSMDLKELITSKKLEVFVEKLRDTPYYNSLKILIKNIGHKDLYRIETELDLLYFERIQRSLKLLDTKDREVILKFIGIEGDILNLSWIFRGRLIYNISPEVLFNLTTPFTFNIRKSLIKELCYIRSFEEFRDKIRISPYDKIYANQNSEEIEIRERAFKYKLYKRFLRENKNDISVVISYLLLMKLEIMNIITIAESKRYNMTFDEIYKYISFSL